MHTGASGTFSDGSGSLDYSDNANCEWIIAPERAAQLTVTFTQFNTEQGYDFLKLYSCITIDCSEKNLLAEMSGIYSSAQAFTSPTGVLYVQFTSDWFVTGSGFTASWTSSEQAATPAPTPAPTDVSV